MKKDLGVVQAVYPMPVLMVAAYDEKEKVNVMNVAWGQICDEDKIILFIGEGKKTWLNIKASRRSAHGRRRFLRNRIRQQNKRQI